MIRENFSLKAYNTFHIDVKARFYDEFNSVEELKRLLTERKQELPLLVLGGGSNILFTSDFNGLVIKNNIKGIEVLKQDNDHVYIKAGAGENWHAFVMYCVEQNYAGIENLSLIPGNVGSGPMQNIGAYGVELKDVMHELEALHINSRQSRTFTNNECRFGYRESIFKHEAKGQYIITSVTFKLNKKPVFNTSYGAIEEELGKMGVKEKTIAAVSGAVCNIRRSKLPDPEITGNAGSFFKNPVVSKELFDSLKQKYPAMPSYPVSDKEVKLAAGWLIEQCGWKGRTQGNAGVHHQQALVLINIGNASGQEVLKLSDDIITSVKNTFGVTLQREVNIL